jgi:hypothetical protein
MCEYNNATPHGTESIYTQSQPPSLQAGVPLSDPEVAALVASAEGTRRQLTGGAGPLLGDGSAGAPPAS